MYKRMAIALVAATSLLVAGCSENTSSPLQPVDTVPPLAPIMIGATVTNGVITAEWQTNTEPDLAGYRVYMDGPDGPIPVSQPLIQRTFVIFEGIGDGGSINIYATAIDLTGNESSASQTVAVNLYEARNSSRTPVEQFSDK